MAERPSRRGSWARVLGVGGALSNRAIDIKRYQSKVEDACVALIEDELFYHQRLACITEEEDDKSYPTYIGIFL